MLKRVKRRYLALAIDSDEMFGSKELMDALWSAISKLYGEYGASQTRLTLISHDVEKKFAVVRTAQTTVDMIRTASASITKIGNKAVAIRILKVSGTLKALHRRLPEARF